MADTEEAGPGHWSVVIRCAVSHPAPAPGRGSHTLLVFVILCLDYAVTLDNRAQ